MYEDFVDHFWNLVPELLTADQDLTDKALSQAVLKKANLQGYQCGKTKVTVQTDICMVHTGQLLIDSVIVQMILLCTCEVKKPLA